MIDKMKITEIKKIKRERAEESDALKDLKYYHKTALLSMEKQS